jgi:hypothetical protein
MDVDTARTGGRRGTRQPSGAARPAGAPGRRKRSLPIPDPDYVLWTHIGSESVFFYPSGSIEEHLVTEHGVPSVNIHWKVKGYYDHAREHTRQGEVRLGAIGDLVAVPHVHVAAA